MSNGELYTILTNKKSKGKKGALIAVCKGTKSEEIKAIIAKIPLNSREMVKEITLDMSAAMQAICRDSFPSARCVTDRFHVQQLVSEAVQDMRVDIRRQVIKEENEAYKNAKREKQKYEPVIFENGDSKKQLLARSRYLLFKPQSKWEEQQKERSKILFKEYPALRKAYNYSMMFRSFYENSFSIMEGKKRLNNWYKKIEEINKDDETKFESFKIVADTIKQHEKTILNYFINRSTNASAESFNAKLKGFRSVVRGVRDKTFFLFRIYKLYS